jgi:hypothetical protein
VYRIDANGEHSYVGPGLVGYVNVLAQAPDGVIWAGGEGLYRLDVDHWTQVWP